MNLGFVVGSLCVALQLGAAVAAHAAGQYVVPQISHPDYGDLNIVMPMATGDESQWNSRMQHALNAVRTATVWNGRAHVKIVVYGAGIRLLTHRDDALANTVQELRAAGIEFLVCNNSLKGMNLDWHELNGVAEHDIVPAGILEVPYLEKQGYFIDPE